MGQKLPFATWLVMQHRRDDQVGELARMARTDPRYPMGGSAQDVSKRLNAEQADWLMHEALEFAEMDWAAL